MIRFVTGTDTGVGKTVVSAALVRDALGQGFRAAYLKPVQTGLAPGAWGDADFVAAATGAPAVEGVRFPDPLTPSVAARRVGSTVDVEALRALVYEQERHVDVLVVEGAGGLLAPLSDELSMADFAGLLDADLIVATRPGLGTLNHTALTLEVARYRGFEPLLVICGLAADPGLAERTNLPLLAAMAEVLGVIPEIPGLDTASPAPPAVALQPVPRFD